MESPVSGAEVVQFEERRSTMSVVGCALGGGELDDQLSLFGLS